MPQLVINLPDFDIDVSEPKKFIAQFLEEAKPMIQESITAWLEEYVRFAHRRLRLTVARHLDLQIHKDFFEMSFEEFSQLTEEEHWQILKKVFEEKKAWIEEQLKAHQAEWILVIGGKVERASSTLDDLPTKAEVYEIGKAKGFAPYLFFLVLVGQLVGIKLCYGKSNNGPQNNIRIKTPEIRGSSMLSDYIRKQSSTLHTRYKRDFESREEFEQHQIQSIKKLRQSLGLYPWPEKNPLNPRVVGKIKRDDIVIEKVIFEARPGYLINAVVFIPNDTTFPVPAIVNPCGHWPDKYQEEVQLRCIQLARRGYIALTYDPIGQGERVWLGGHEDVRRQAILSGHSLSGMMFWDTIRCIDYLYTRLDVDKNGVGCIGLSGGGFNTLYTSVLDERIKVSVPTVYATNFEMLIQRGSAGCCAYLPNHATYGEIDDIYALIAPRPLLILAGGEEDKWLNGGAMQNYKVAKGSYRLYGLDRLEVFIDESVGHTLTLRFTRSRCGRSCMNY